MVLLSKSLSYDKHSLIRKNNLCQISKCGMFLLKMINLLSKYTFFKFTGFGKESGQKFSNLRINKSKMHHIQKSNSTSLTNAGYL